LLVREKGAPEKEPEPVMKIRGLTLSHDIVSKDKQGFTYERFKEKVLEYAQTGETAVIDLLYPRFFRPSIKDGHVITEPMKKIYRPYIGKGIIGADYTIHSFGYIRP
jgi:hypothetical protein